MTTCVTTRVTSWAAALVSRMSPLCRSTLTCACTPLTKSEERENAHSLQSKWSYTKVKQNEGVSSVSWCRSNHCWFTFVLWRGYCSFSFQSFVLRHLVTALVINTKKLPKIMLLKSTEKGHLKVSRNISWSWSPLHQRPTKLAKWVFFGTKNYLKNIKELFFVQQVHLLLVGIKFYIFIIV